MTPDAPRPMGLLEWTLLIALSVLWGGSFFFNAIAVAELPVLTIVAARVGLAALALWAVLLATGGSLPRRVWGACLVMGVLNNAVPFGLIVWGQAHIASGVAAILNATTPLFGVLVAHAFNADERLTPSRLAGVVIGIAGVAVMMGGAAVRDLGALPGQLAVLGAAASYAAAGVFGRRFRALGVAPLQVATGQVTGSSLILVPLALAVDRPWTAAPSAASLGAVVALALLCTAVAYLLYFRILATAGAVNILLVTLLVPVSAILLGVTFLGETLAPRHVAGIAAIAIGLAAIDGRPLARIRRSPAARAP